MKISIIVPCYNNAGSIPELWERLILLSSKPIFQEHKFEFVFVDDGSSDRTLYELQKLKPFSDNLIRLIKLTRNFGSYNSFLAGMTHATGECNVYLHADLQDPPELIEEQFSYFLKGIPLVIANRLSREDGSLLSTFYHWIVRKYALKKAPIGGYDLIMFSSKIRDEVVEIGEKSTNNVYLISWLGYPFVQIPYNRVKRKHGHSQWSTRKKIHLFIDTIFSFTNIPLSVIRFLGLIGILHFPIASVFFVLNKTMPFQIWFWASLILLFLSIFILVVTEYIIRIHETVRNRPNFVVEKVIDISKIN
jgi:glycosyltransferase involved in cell wall biosynthesis